MPHMQEHPPRKDCIVTARTDALAAVERLNRDSYDRNGAGARQKVADLALVRAALAPELPADLAEIQGRADAATPGPWGNYTPNPRHNFLHVIEAEALDGDPLRLDIGEGLRGRDAEFIAHARTDVPALVAELAERRAAPQLTAEEAHMALEWWDVYDDRMAGMTSELSEATHMKLRAIAEQAT
jgi:hypothetical protein